MIKGLKELERSLNKTAEELNEGLARGVHKGSKHVQAAAKLGCPNNDGELRESIKEAQEGQQNIFRGTVYTNKPYGPYVELGTGPRGQEDHAGISPAVNPSYTQNVWWIHESQIDKAVAERYHMFSIETKEGVFYQSSGQAAQPFMYPAAKNSEDKVTEIIGKEIGIHIRKG